MSYRNPQIVQPSKAGEIYAQAIAGFGKQAAGAMQAVGDKRRAEEKALNAEAEVNRQIYNKIDIENAEMQADMTQKIKDFQLRDQLAPILTKSIEDYGDAKIALLTEKNPEMRAQYKAQLQKSYATMLDAKTFTESIQGDAGRYSTIDNGAEFGSTLGLAGEGEEAQETNQMFLAAISGRLPNGSITMRLNPEGGIDLTAMNNGKPIRTVNSLKYGQSGNELIFDAPDTITEMQKEVDAQIRNDAGGLKKEYIKDPEIRRFTSGKDNFEQQINRIEVDRILNAGDSSFKGQAAAFGKMNNQQKAFVWKNQLKQGSGYKGALGATPQQIEQAYKDVARTELLKEAEIDSETINGEIVYFQGSKPQLVKPAKDEPPKDSDKIKPSDVADSAIEDFNGMIADLDFTNLKGETIRGIKVQDATISGDNLILTFDSGAVTEDVNGVKSKKIITDEKVIDLNDKKEINSILGDYLKSIYGADANIDKAIFNLRSKQDNIKTIEETYKEKNVQYPTVLAVPPHLRKK